MLLAGCSGQMGGGAWGCSSGCSGGHRGAQPTVPLPTLVPTCHPCRLSPTSLNSCWKNAFWFVTLLYPRCAMTALQLFGWQTMDVGTFLKADFSVMVCWAV